MNSISNNLVGRRSVGQSFEINYINSNYIQQPQQLTRQTNTNRKSRKKQQQQKTKTLEELEALVKFR